MLDYDRRSWWRTCFSYRYTVLPRVLMRVLEITGFTLGVCLLDDYVLSHYGKRLPQLDTMLHTVFGTALSLLIVFRTNASNNRYWEGRSHWGSLVNASRNLARGAATYARPAEDFGRSIIAYVIAIRQHLRGHRDPEPLRPYLPEREAERAVRANNPPAYLAKRLSAWVASRQEQGKIAEFEAMRLEGLVCALTDAQGGCEKIRSTPMPFNYASFIKQVLVIYLFTLPFVLVPRMGFVSIIAMAAAAFALFGIEEAGIETEEPFGYDPNDLPLEAITENIARDVVELTNE